MYRFFREIQTRIEKAHPNLLFAHGWLIPQPGVLHVLMDKAELDVTTALQPSFLPLKTRLKIAVDVANGCRQFTVQIMSIKTLKRIPYWYAFKDHHLPA